GDPNEPGDDECMVVRRDDGHRLLFIEVPEGKVGKNRIHLDLEPVEGSRDDELARLIAHGATEVADLRGTWGPGTGWVVLTDPEGNEFCILRSSAERTETAPPQ
ncbi:MAG: VOC family protein, partial [Dermatophilaceae bacterium]